MNSVLNIEKISRKEFFDLKEENLMFITNPGRMGDISGSTFVIKKDNDYKIYRIDGWLYPNKEDKNFISIDEIFSIFPKWKVTLDNYNNDYYSDKYNYIYMGYGNGLCVDKKIYDEYYPYLLEEVKKQNSYSKEDGNNYNPYLNYSSWQQALKNMNNNILN